jgi:type I restriction enzyme S subunit
MRVERIGNIARFINGAPFKPEDWAESGMKIIRIQNLTDPSKPYNRTNREVDNKYTVTKGDVLVSWSATIDVFTWEDEDALLNQHIFKVIFDKSKVDKYYFIIALKGTIHELTKFAHGSTMKHVVKGDFENHKIPLPTIPEQLVIANLLTKAENLISQRKQSIALLDEFLKSTFLEMFGDPVRNEKDWKIRSFEELVAKDCPLTYGIVQPGIEFPNGIPVIRPVDLKQTFISREGLKLIDPEISRQFKRTVLKGGELLMCVRGTTGITSIASKEVAGCNVTRGITPIWFSENYNTFFAFHLLQSQAIRNRITELTYGATLQQINLGDLRKIMLINPLITLQNQFAKIAEKTEALKSQYKSSLHELENLYGSLSQRAFRGELTFK